MNILIKGFCKKSSPNSNGKCKVYVKIQAGRAEKPKFIPTRHFVLPTHFDNTSGICVKSPIKNQVNAEIAKITSEIQAIVNRIYYQGTTPTLLLIKDLYENKYDQSLFYEYARKQLDLDSPTLTAPTYNLCLNQLRDYHPELKTAQITPEYLQQYLIGHLINERKRKANGVYHNYATIKKYVTRAYKDGLIPTNPFDKFTLKKEKPSINYLTPLEVQQLADLMSTDKLRSSLRRTLFYFLLSCYTGLRVKDIVELSNRVKKDPALLQKMKIEGIKLYTSKSRYKKEAIIPIYKKLEAHLAYWPNIPLKQSSSDRNDDIKQILKAAGIDKKVTYHGSRHTFGVMAKMAGIDTHVLKEILTHSDLKTTDIYAHIAENLVHKEIQKLDL